MMLGTGRFDKRMLHSITNQSDLDWILTKDKKTEAQHFTYTSRSRSQDRIDWIEQCFTSPPTHSIGYMGDGFYRSKDPTNSITVLKEQRVHRQIKHTISWHEHKTQQSRSKAVKTLSDEMQPSPSQPVFGLKVRRLLIWQDWTQILSYFSHHIHSAFCGMVK